MRNGYFENCLENCCIIYQKLPFIKQLVSIENNLTDNNLISPHKLQGKFTPKKTLAKSSSGKLYFTPVQCKVFLIFNGCALSRFHLFVLKRYSSNIQKNLLCFKGYPTNNYLVNRGICLLSLNISHIAFFHYWPSHTFNLTVTKVAKQTKQHILYPKQTRQHILYSYWYAPGFKS